MARVCKELFPNPDPDKAGFYMDDQLKIQLDVMIKNVIRDWDFTILISGQGEMRVGKSLIGLQIGAYWTDQMLKVHKMKVPFDVKKNVVFNGSDLVKKGMALGTKHNYACLDYDEAADDMEGTKVMKGSSQQIKDYLRKSAQFNMLNIIVQSEFFEVPKYLAISRSSCLIDVTYGADDYGNFRRGYGRFYSRRSKKKLYLLGKKMLDYNSYKPDFRFTFPNFYPVDEKEYRAEKRETLLRWDQMTAREQRYRSWTIGLLTYLYSTGLSHREIAETLSQHSKIKISHAWVGKLLKNEKIDEDYEEGP